MTYIRSLRELTGKERYLSGMLPLDGGFIVKNGYIYMPALYSEGLEKTIADEGANPALVMAEGKAFVQSLDLRPLVENYEQINPNNFGKFKKTLLDKYNFDPSQAVLGNSALKTIIFEVLPYFAKNTANLGIRAKKLTEREIIQMISSTMDIPPEYYNKAEQLYDTSGLIKKISELELQGGAISTPDSITSAKEIDKWFANSLKDHILSTELEVLKQALVTRSEISSKNKEYIATLLFLQNKHSFEFGGVGFEKGTESSTEYGYTVYVHTGEYALQDFDGSVYLMGDCKVSISTQDLWPRVMGRYNNRYIHPFLNRNGGSSLCITDYQAPHRFTGENAIKALTTGLNTVFYGYMHTPFFHPYDKLDSGRYTRISENDPRIKSGKIEIKNATLV